jgi:hypothetical protein
LKIQPFLHSVSSRIAVIVAAVAVVAAVDVVVAAVALVSFGQACCKLSALHYFLNCCC